IQGLEKIARVDLAIACLARNHEFSAERNTAGRPFGRGIGERDAAAYRADVADRDVRDMRRRLCEQWQRLRDFGRAFNFSVGGQRAYSHLAIRNSYAGEP